MICKFSDTIITEEKYDFSWGKESREKEGGE